ncbi:MAG: restriction endonuclease subunit S [Planctomycetes bacterium]|nr:restriction endonuclease subunit S [Planctomycetota bacterium]
MTTKHHLGDLFHCRKESGKAGLPVTSVTMNNGLVQRDTLDRKSNGRLEPEGHLLIRKGDIAYNMMRMWQGASGLAEHDGMVSPAYVVVAPTDRIDPLFASYWFKSARMIYLFWAYSYGITSDRLRLYFKDFAKIPVTVPPKPEQERIGRILSTSDRVIDRTEKLIEAKRKLKKGLAQQLLTGKCRLPGFDRAWKQVPIRELCTITYGRSQANIVSQSGRYAIYGTGGVVGQTDKYLHSGPAIILGRKGSIDRPFLALQPFWAIDTTFCAVPMEDVSANWLHQMFLTVKWRRYNEASGVPSLSRKTVYSIRLAKPRTDEQERIASVLGAADREIGLLEKKLAALHELKRGLMQKLLTGQVCVKIKETS